MDRVELRAPAKLNLRLQVGPLGTDGYHPLVSLMVALDGPCDTIQVARAPARRVDCPGIDGPENLAWRALEALEEEVGRALPVEVTIAKAIPARAGLGGGSSDAAAVLVGVDRLHDLGLGAERLEAVAARVGADVPFFVRGGTQWARGRGERLSPAPPLRFAALLAQPAARLSTSEVYAAFDRLPPPAAGEPAPVPEDFAALAAWTHNDLWPAALALAPSLGAPARALAACGAASVLLCGSGSCLAGLFPDRASAEAALAAMPAGLALGVAEPAPSRLDP